MMSKDFKLLFSKICFYFFIFLLAAALLFFAIFFELYPVELQMYMPDLKLLLKQIIIPKELEQLRSCNDYSIYKLNKLSSEMRSLQDQKLILKQEVNTIKKLLVSEAYDVKPSKNQLLNKAVMEEKLLNEKTEGQPGLVQLCFTGLVAYIILKSIILLNIGWDK